MLYWQMTLVFVFVTLGVVFVTLVLVFVTLVLVFVTLGIVFVTFGVVIEKFVVDFVAFVAKFLEFLFVSMIVFIFRLVRQCLHMNYQVEDPFRIMCMLAISSCLLSI